MSDVIVLAENTGQIRRVHRDRSPSRTLLHSLQDLPGPISASAHNGIY